MRGLKLVSLVCASLLVVFCASQARSHPAEIETSFTGVGPGVAQMYVHDDDEPFKGYVYVYVTNNSSVPWGDFHFEIFAIPPDYQSVQNVHILTVAPYEPTSSQSGLTWVIDNTPTTGSTADLYFYSDPVGVGQSAWFQIYTDNTTDKVRFGVMLWPTPIPEPSTIAAFLSAVIVGACYIGRRFIL